ncbi:I17RD protein, partial [Amia calva]|nr:I17RD protein [Amia calva]
MGLDSPSLCQHFVGAPRDVTVEFVYSQDPGYDTVVVSWRPSQYGISFLRGFQVSVQALGGMLVGCQLLLFQRNLSLEAVDAEKVYQSDPFPALALGSQYVATVMALPVPEQWEKYQQEEKYQQSKQFSTQTCTKKRVLAKCRRDWYPTDIAVEQEGADVIVTFNLAPPSLGINGYFSYCYGAGTRNYTEFKVNPSENQTHHSFRLAGLRGGVNYSCGVTADQVDPVHKGFTFHMKPPPQVRGIEKLFQKDWSRSPHNLCPSPSPEPPPPGPNLESVILVLLLFVTVLLALVAVGFLLFLKKWKEGRRKRAEMQAPAPCNYKEAPREGPSTQPRPPRLLLCYSNRDGPAHIGVVMRLAAFLQQHMSTQVHLDLWEGLSLVEEGPMGWYTRRMQESDFVLAVCSRGLCQLLDKRAQHHREKEEEEEEESWDGDVSAAAVSLIGEEMGWAASRGQDLSKYMAAIFEYSRETDFPGLLGLASRYVLPQDLPLLFSHLHGVALHGPGRQLLVENVSGEGYLSVPAGAALSRAITEAKGAGEDEGRLGGEEEALL